MKNLNLRSRKLCLLHLIGVDLFRSNHPSSVRYWLHVRKII